MEKFVFSLTNLPDIVHEVKSAFIAANFDPMCASQSQPDAMYAFRSMRQNVAPSLAFKVWIGMNLYLSWIPIRIHISCVPAVKKSSAKRNIRITTSMSFANTTKSVYFPKLLTTRAG